MMLVLKGLWLKIGLTLGLFLSFWLVYITVNTLAAPSSKVDSGRAGPLPAAEEAAFQKEAALNATAISRYQTAGANPAGSAAPATPDLAGLTPAQLSSLGQLTFRTPECDIKGNITLDNPPLYRYHVRSQNYYSTVVIEPERGERWFCTEQDAVKNGWRKSRE